MIFSGRCFRNVALSMLVVAPAVCWGHAGPRLEVVVHHGQLALRGYDSTLPLGGENPRTYYNALSSTWNNVGSSTAIADLPGFDLFATSDSVSGEGAAEHLAGATVELTLTGVYQWTDPLSSPSNTLPNLQPLAPATTITIGNASQLVDSQTLGTLTLASNVAATGATDIDLDYVIDGQPDNTLHVLEWSVTTTKPGIAASQSAYIVLAPDPSAAPDLSAAASLLEQYLSTPLVAGDFNRDGFVTSADYLVWKSQFGTDGFIAGLGADGNADGTINLADYTLWRDNLGGGLLPDYNRVPLSQIPEPATRGLLLMVLAGLLLIPKHRYVLQQIIQLASPSNAYRNTYSL